MKLPRKLALSLSVGVACFAGAELGARAVLAARGEPAAPISLGEGGEWDELNRLIYRPDPQLFFRLKPNLDIDQTGNPRVFDLQTDARGMRTHSPSDLGPEAIRILCLGDSCTFGSGAGAADTWPAQLEARLNEGRPEPGYLVFNGGVPGFTSFQGRRFLETEGFDLEPDIVIFTFGFNDSFQGRAGVKRDFGDGVYLTDREYADQLQAPSRWAVARLWAQVRGGDGAEREPVEISNDTKRRVPPEDYRRNLKAVVRTCQERGIRPVLIVWPIIQQAEANGALGRHSFLPGYQDLVRAVADRAGATVVDLVPLVEGRPTLFVDDVHMNRRGYRLVAEALATALRD